METRPIFGRSTAAENYRNVFAECAQVCACCFKYPSCPSDKYDGLEKDYNEGAASEARRCLEHRATDDNGPESDEIWPK